MRRGIRYSMAVRKAISQQRPDWEESQGTCVHLLDKTLETHLLYDWYGSLLTERQRRIVEMRYFDDLSLAEIGESLGISRQAVNDTIRRAELQLREYERRLGLLSRFRERMETIRRVEEKLRDEYGVNEDVLRTIRALT